MSRTRRRVVVFDSDGVNPYGAELALQLATSFEVDTCLPSDAKFDGPSRVFPLRGTRKGGSNLATSCREVLTLLGVLYRVVRGDVLVVVWARAYQKAMFGLVSSLFRRVRVLYIAHNPGSGRDSTSFGRTFVERRLVRGAQVTVVHGRQMADGVAPLAPRRTAVVPHLMFEHYVERFGLQFGASPAGHADVLLLLGAVRPDKFSTDDVESLLAAIASEESNRGGSGTVRVRLCVRPAMNLPTVVGVDVENLSRDGWIPDAVVVDALASSGKLLAPYRNVTDSGTIALALSAGCDVVAFRGGALSDYLMADQLIDSGDWASFARAALAEGAPQEVRRERVIRRSSEIRKIWVALLRDLG